MLAVYLSLIDVRADHPCQTDHNRNVAQTLTKVSRKSLVVNTCRIAEATVEDIGECLE